MASISLYKLPWQALKIKEKEKWPKEREKISLRAFEEIARPGFEAPPYIS